MKNNQFKRAVEPKEEIAGLAQPASFLGSTTKTKQWSEYQSDINKEKENYEQVLYSVAVEPTMKEALQIAGKNRGRSKGGAKSVIREALTSYFEKHPELFQ